MEYNILGMVFIIIFVLFIFFLIIRELMCWYWKINMIIDALEKIQKILLAQSRSYGNVDKVK